ncbi:hypothetical protein GCM10011504_41150 [Siccirubricoccus deserti]|uniref:Uncharacterized protein n=1 Tax=Siccirubricoccus deserti TaxID=2013562 RepID=A0A9X0R130_9PROT|nr:hypothetical protein [Siccirubricoccus deserti]MBC4017340.1 hypothetical protein [Siccirubricoccus deserti]GGC58713.1 hypothetical protein GCM10011504_41150 [Siccirubricoccus deserti]
MSEDQDATVRLTPAAQAAAPATPAGAKAISTAGQGLPRTGLAVCAAVLALSCIAAWLLLVSPAPKRPQDVQPVVPELPTAPVAALPYKVAPMLDEAGILALQPEQPIMLRLQSNPAIFVLLFTDLDQQGAALNRVAALIEKRGLPRDRLLTDAELAAAIAASGDTPATWFFGHDYRASDLGRFFSFALRDGVPLNEAELWVRDRLRDALAQSKPGGAVALVSVANAGPQMDATMRAVILRHEVAHGHYFTLPGFAAHVHMVWHDRFSDADRVAFTTLFAREGYDTTNAELMANEAMAYMLFTPDPRIFNAGMVGMTEPQLDRLRELMRLGLPLP